MSLKSKNKRKRMVPQKISKNQNNLEKKEQIRGIMLPDFILYYKTAVIKTVLYEPKKPQR